MSTKLLMKIHFPLKIQYLSKDVGIWRGETPFKTMLEYLLGYLPPENHVMCSAQQFCHDGGFACREECFFYQDSGDLKQLLGDGGTRDRGKGQSVAYWAGCSSSSSPTIEFYFLEGSLANVHLAVFLLGDELK